MAFDGSGNVHCLDTVKTRVVKATPGTANQVAISAMLVLALGSASPDYAVDRILETLIGAAIGFVVNVAVVPPVLVEPVRRDLALLGAELAETLDRLGDAITEDQSQAHLQELMLKARLLRPMKDAADASLGAGEESLTLNPRGSRHRTELAAMGALLERLGPIVTQVIGMTRAYVDQYDTTLPAEPAVPAIAEQLHRAGHDVRLAVQLAEVVPEPEALTSAIPALTSPLDIRPPSSRNWVLIGSLTEDLRRIRAGLRDEA